MLSNSDRTKNPSTSSNDWLRRDEFLHSLPIKSLPERQLALGAAHKLGAVVACRRSPDLARLLLTGIGSLPARSAERLNCLDCLAIGRTAANTPMT
jgi:hypothetical protein